jgi:hypothetical protein
MNFVVPLIPGEPEQRGHLIHAIRRLQSADVAVVDCDEDPGAVCLQVTSCSNLLAAAGRAIQIVAVAGVAAGTKFHVAAGALSWPPSRR